MSAKRDFWFQHINAWQVSDLSQAEYVRQHNLSAKCFGYYRRRYFQSLPAEMAEPKRTSLLPVQIDNDSETLSENQGSIFLTTPGGYRITLSSGFNADALQRVIRVLEAV
ncbi:hypothetical protein GCM10023116_38970 [Kistimonas scapharcae]|uniref:Transposase n=1 Tax=Kistimonas scapharcae TaxID=1036133 RepID=A0ABP8V5T1_9GAMM